MKLAEALKERSDLNKKIEQLSDRINNNALYQEGTTPAEEPIDLLKELDASVARLQALMAAINHTNATTTIEEGQTITQLIAEKDALTMQVRIYRSLVEKASQRIDRYSKTEIRILSAVDVKALQKKTDKISKRIRQLDNTLQEFNWRTEVDI